MNIRSHRYKLLGIALALVIVGVGAPRVNAQSAAYTQAWDLGTLGGTYSNPTAANPTGQVVGSSSTSNNQTHAFSWTPTGGMIDLGTLGGTSSQATAVSSSGFVVGSSNLTGDQSSHAFLWTSAGGMVDLGNCAGSYASAQGINAGGMIVGYCTLPGNSTEDAFVWTQAGGLVDIGGLPNNAGSVALSVNDAGTVIGYSVVNGTLHTWVWTQSTGMADIGNLGGSNSSTYPYAINASGQIAGTSTIASGYNEVFLWTPTTPNTTSGSMIGLTLPGSNSGSGISGAEQSALSNTGYVTGFSYNNNSQHAFLYTPGVGISDLGLVSGDSSNGSSMGAGVTDNGTVVGSHYSGNGGNTHAAVWKPSAAGVDVDPTGSSQNYSQITGVSRGGYYAFGQISTSSGSHAYVWLFAPPPTVTINVAGAYLGGLSGATITFTVTAVGSPACMLDGSPFTSGGTASLGLHTLLCTTTDPSSGAKGTGTATVDVEYNGGASTQGAVGPQGPQGPAGPQDPWVRRDRKVRWVRRASTARKVRKGRQVRPAPWARSVQRDRPVQRVRQAQRVRLDSQVRPVRRGRQVQRGQPVRRGRWGSKVWRASGSASTFTAFQRTRPWCCRPTITARCTWSRRAAATSRSRCRPQPRLRRASSRLHAWTMATTCSSRRRVAIRSKARTSRFRWTTRTTATRW